MFLTFVSLGLNILSSWIGTDAAANTVPGPSGTSTASPYTAGLLAYLLPLSGPHDAQH